MARARSRLAHERRRPRRRGLSVLPRRERFRGPARARVRVTGIIRVGTRDVPGQGGGGRAAVAAAGVALRRMCILLGVKAGVY